MSEENSIACPLVSVIIRSMDRPTLTEAIDSVAAQTYPNIEVVLVNAKGAGHREVGEWCGRFPQRIITVAEESPLHRSRAGNVGLRAANGEYLLFLDDDDWLAANHIDKLVVALSAYPDYLAAHTGIACVNETKQTTTQVFEQPFDAMLLMTINFMPIHAVLFSRKLIECGCLMDETLDYYEDWDFWLQASSQGDFVYTPGISGYYRIYSSSGVHQQKTFSGEAYIHIYDKWRSRWPTERLAKLMGTCWGMHIAQAQIKRELTDAQMQLTNTQMQLTNTQIQLAGCHAELNSIYLSRSWRITAPLRQINQIIRNFLNYL